MRTAADDIVVDDAASEARPPEWLEYLARIRKTAEESKKDLAENDCEIMRRMIARCACATPPETFHELLPVWESVFADDPDMLARFAVIPRAAVPRAAGECEDAHDAEDEEGPAFLRDLGCRVERHDERYWRVFCCLYGTKLFWKNGSFFSTKEEARAYAADVAPRFAELRGGLNARIRARVVRTS